MLPGLREHTCSRGRRGGFLERLNEGTWLGHVAEHAALALQQTVGHDIRRGKTRAVKGQPGHYNIIYGYIDENVGLTAGQLAVRLVNHLVEGDPDFDWEAERDDFIRRAERTAFGPSTQAIVDEAVSRDIPWIRLNQHSLVQLGQGVHAKRIRATMTSRDLLDRRRHRLRQGPHDQAAGCGRPPGAEAGLGPHRRAGRLGRQPDRLPLRAQAARRQPRPRGVPRPARTRTTYATPSRSPTTSPGGATSSSSRSSPARTTAA